MKKGILFLFSLLATTNLKAQGCADAGFCTAGALKTSNQSNESVKDYGSIGMSGTVGYGEQGTVVFIPQLEIGKNLSANSSVEIKLPYYIATGNLGTTSGIGDIIATYTQSIYRQKDKWDIKGTIGGRVSLGKSNLNNKNGLPLPMPYQPNLGTTDVIGGLNIRYKKHYVFTVGLQQPMVNYNDNQYYSGVYFSADTSYQQYFSSRKLERRGDALLRLEYDKDWKQDGIAASTLFIYHLGNDIITTPSGNKVDARGSAGLTLNLTFNYYRNYKKWRFEAGIGAPVIVREYRPDGLTRAFVVTPRATYFFRKKR